MNYPLVVAASVGSTAFFGVSTVLKHRSATTVTTGDGPLLLRLGRLAISTLTHPWWLAGLAADAAGLALQALALHIGALSVVQPLMVTGLLISLVISHLTRGTRIGHHELRWAVLLVLTLVGFLAVSGASSTTSSPQSPDRGAAVVSAALALALAVACVVLARRVPAGRRAALIGIAVGTLYACTAVLIKAATAVLAAHGWVAMLTSWQLGALAASAAADLLLTQLAFRAGPLNTSLPAITTVDPLLSVALGVVVYDEHLRTGPVAIAAEALLLLGLAVAAIALSRLNATTDHATESTPTSTG